MFRFFCFFCLIGLLCACTSGPKPPAVDDQTDSNLTLIKNLYAAANRHDWPEVASYYSNPTRFLEPSMGADYHPVLHEEIIARYVSLEEAYSNFRMEIVGIYPYRNTVTVEYVSTGAEITGHLWKLPMCSVFTLKDGKIVQEAVYYNQSGGGR